MSQFYKIMGSSLVKSMKNPQWDKKSTIISNRTNLGQSQCFKTKIVSSDSTCDPSPGVYPIDTTMINQMPKFEPTSMVAWVYHVQVACAMGTLLQIGKWSSWHGDQSQKIDSYCSVIKIQELLAFWFLVQVTHRKVPSAVIKHGKLKIHASYWGFNRISSPIFIVYEFQQAIFDDTGW